MSKRLKEREAKERGYRVASFYRGLAEETKKTDKEATMIFKCKWHELAGQQITFKNRFSELLVNMEIVTYNEVNTCPVCASERYFNGWEMKPNQEETNKLEEGVK